MEGSPRAFAISITPFSEDGALDERGLRAHLRRLAASGIGIYVGGSGSGEGYALSRDETRTLLEIAVDEVKGKTPIRAMGVEPRSAEQMISFIHLAEECGVDAAQIYSLDIGHGHAPTQEELRAYFDEVLSATKLPLALSTHQSVGYVISAEVIASLFADYEHLIDLNCSHQELNYLGQLTRSLKHRANVMVGGPHQALTCLSLGGRGFLSSEANLAPKLCMSVVNAFDKGDLETMMANYGKLLRVFTTTYANGGIRATKAALNVLGVAGGWPRKPRLPATRDGLQRLMDVIEAEGLEEMEQWREWRL